MNENETALLRKLQLVERDILFRVVDVCEKHEIEYFMSCGTLLGAVRHGGFIPWDDDVDIEIPIPDYYRFLEIAQEKLGDEYFVQTYMTDPDYHFAYAKIRKNNTAFLNRYQRHYHIHHGIWIDIFPLVPTNTGPLLKVKKRWLSLCNFVQTQGEIDYYRKDYEELLGSAGVTLLRAFLKIPMETRQRIHAKMLGVVFDVDSAKCSHRTYVWGNITRLIPKEIYHGEPQWLPFEGRMLRVPPKYTEYLRVVYGNYMELPPVEERHGHFSDAIVDLENSYERYMLFD